MPDPAAGNTTSDFIHSIGDACMLVDESLTIAASNGAAESLYRAVDRPLDTTSFLDRCRECDHEDISTRIASCNGTPGTFTITQVRHDGTTFNAEITAATAIHGPTRGHTLVVRERPVRLSGFADELAIRDIALEHALDGVVVHTAEGILLYANKAACDQWGVGCIDDVIDKGPFGWVPENERDDIRKRMDMLVSEGEARFDTYGRKRNGVRLNVEIHARLVDTENGPVIVSTARDVTERIQTEEMVRYLAYHDMLTGLANRVRLGQELAHQISMADRHHDLLGVIFMDLNDFKPVNDSYGHTIGDHVLREVADRLAGSIRENDLVARLGGDEFVVVLPRLQDEKYLPAIAEKLARRISEPIQVGGQTITVNGTFGMAAHRRGEDADSLLIRADMAMYDAREKQVPGWVLFDS